MTGVAQSPLTGRSASGSVRSMTLWLLLGAIALLLCSVVMISSAFSHNLGSAPTVVGTSQVHLAAGDYVVYQDAGDASFPLPPSALSIVRDGARIPTFSKTTYVGYQLPIPSLSANAYENIIGFHIHDPGKYVICSLIALLRKWIASSGVFCNLNSNGGVIGFTSSVNDKYSRKSFLSSSDCRSSQLAFRFPTAGILVSTKLCETISR